MGIFKLNSKLNEVRLHLYRGEPTQILLENTTNLNALNPVFVVPEGKQITITHIRVTNLFNDLNGEINIKTGSSAAFSNGNFILRTTVVQPGDTVIFDMNEVLLSNDKIFVWQGDSSVAVQISGIEVTL